MGDAKEPVDLVVIGLGIVGLSTVYQASREAVRVVGVEQFGAVLHTRGSSHGESRVTRQAYSEGPEYVPLLLAAHAEWDALGRAAGRSLLHRTGVVYVAPGHEAAGVVRGALASSRRYGVPVEVWDDAHAELQRRVPAMRGHAGEVAVWEPGGGWIDADGARLAMHALACRQGAQLRYGTRATGWSVDEATGLVTVHLGDGQGSIVTKAVAVTAGPWTDRLVPQLQLHPKRRILAWYDAEGDDTNLVDGGGPVFMLHRDNRLMYGFPPTTMNINGRLRRVRKLALHFAPNLSSTDAAQPDCDPDTVRRTVDDAELHELDEMAVSLFPTLGARVHSVVCMYTNTEDCHFVLDTLHTGKHGCVAVAAGFSGHGFKFGSVIGKVVRDLAFGRPSEFDLSWFRMGRPGILKSKL